MHQALRNPWFVLAAAAAFALAMPYLLDGVNVLGARIPELDRANDYLKAVLLAAGLALGLFFAPVPAEDRKNLIVLWGAKAAVCLVVMLAYDWNYGLDAYWYFERSQYIFPDFVNLGFGQGTENFVAALWYLDHYIFPVSSFHSQKILCSFLGLGGIYLFYRGLANQVEHLAPRTLYYIGLCPSVLFWSSILGKDPVNLFGICLFFYGALTFLRRYNPFFLIHAAAGLLVTGLMRTWLVPMLLLPFALAFVLKIPNRLLRALALGAFAVVLLLGLQKISASLALESAESLQGVNVVSRAWSRGGSAGEIPQLTSTSAMLQFLPYGMFTALFRPLPGEVLNPFGLLAGAENLLILYLLVLAIRRPARGAWKSLTVITFASFIVIWAICYAFISPQNLGAAVRFRLQVMPAMIFLLLYVPRKIRPRVLLNPRERRYSTEST